MFAGQRAVYARTVDASAIVRLSLFPRTEYRPPPSPAEDAFPEVTAWRTPSAPLPLWQEAGFVAVDAVVIAIGSRVRGRLAILTGLGAAAVFGRVYYPLRERLERRRAQEFGLTLENTPMGSPTGCLNTLPWLAIWSLSLRLRGIEFARPSWPEELAVRLVSEWYRRRSWNRAMAEIRARAPARP